jgi:hypothetical protein
MAEITEATQRIEARLDADELRALDTLCARDLRTRPQEIKWLIATETQRRAEASADLRVAS